LPQELINQGGLAMVDMRNDGNVTNLIHSGSHRLRAQPAPIDGTTMARAATRCPAILGARNMPATLSVVKPSL